jgi:hypothetical protein
MKVGDVYRVRGRDGTISRNVVIRMTKTQAVCDTGLRLKKWCVDMAKIVGASAWEAQVAYLWTDTDQREWRSQRVRGRLYRFWQMGKDLTDEQLDILDKAFNECAALTVAKESS